MRRLVLLGCFVAMLTACGGSDDLEGVTVTGTAQRVDEGTPLLAIAIHNDGPREIAVEQIRLKLAGLAGPAVAVNRSISSGDAIAVKASYRSGVCVRGTVAPTLEVRTPDAIVSLPVKLHPASLPETIRERECNLAALAQQATVSLTPGRIDGQAYRTELAIDRVGDGPLRIVDVGGSVLLELAAAVPRTVAPTGSTRIPVTITPTDRCDPHAQSQSSQTFLFSAYVEVGDAARDVRAVLPLTATMKADLQTLISRHCAGG